jgi:hypothetical protein
MAVRRARITLHNTGNTPRRRVIIPATKSSAENGRTISIRSPELKEVGRQMAALALERLRQGGKLKVRQREQLRRTFSEAGEFLGWDAIPGQQADAVAAVTSDVTKLTKAGVRSMEKDLADDLETKKKELSKLKRVATSLEKLAGAKEDAFPTEVEFSHSARDSSRGLVTKVETLTLEDASEAQQAAEKIHKRLDSYGKLRDEMIVELKQRQKQIDEMKKEVGSFADSSRRLLTEVLAVLH